MEDKKLVPPTHASDTSTSADSQSRAYLPSTDVHLLAVPGFELLEKIGQGGMGVVYRVRHLKLGRFAAVKLIPNVEHAGPDARARFLAEAQVIAHARHPNVVEVFDYGEVDGTPYLVMELLAHGSLGDRLRKAERVDVAGMAGVLKKVVRAVAAVHAKGVVHRDLKPANILFDESGEPKVTDFGLAKRPDSELTGTHAVMGTVTYMSPEQARGQAKFIGPASDVWSLGVILYECLTGVRPFGGDSAFDVMTNIVSETPVPVRDRNAALPADLAAVVEKCLRKNAAERYPSAAELAAALDRVHLDGLEAVTLTAPPNGYPPVAAASRSRGRWVAAAAVLALLAVGTIAISQWPKREPEPRATGGVNPLSDPTPSKETPDKGPVRKQMPASEYWTAATQPKVTTLTGHGAKVTFAMFSPDGTRVVTASEDKTARVWDVATGAEVFALKGHTFGVFTAAFSPDGSRIVTAGHDATGRVWDAKTGKELFGLKTPHSYGSFYSALFDAAGKRIVAAVTTDYAAAVWDATTGQEQRVFKGHGRAVGFASFNPDGTRVVTASDDATAKVWDAKSGTELLTFKGHADWVKSALFSPDGTRIVTASWDRSTKVWDAKTGAELLTLQAGEGIVHFAAYSADGSRIVTASGDYLARVWDATTGKELLNLKGHERTVFSAAFSPDGTKIVTAGDDGTAKIWAARP